MTKTYRTRIYERYFSATYAMANRADEAGFRRSAAVLRQIILPWLPPDRNARIVDIGCGIGYAVEMLTREGYRNVQGIDTSEQQVAVARARGLPVVRGDAFEYLVGQSERLDGVIALDFIEHLDRDELFRFLDLVRNVLRPGGRLIVKTANANSPTAARLRYVDLTHELIFTEHSLRTAFAVSGLCPLTIHGERYRPVSGAGWLRWLLTGATHALWRLFLIGELGREAFGLPLEFNLIGVAEKPARDGPP